MRSVIEIKITFGNFVNGKLCLVKLQIMGNFNKADPFKCFLLDDIEQSQQSNESTGKHFPIDVINCLLHQFT